MSEIARFYGIVIKMFFKPKEHDPSHLHAIYGECVGVFDLQSLEMTDGDLPLTAQRLVKEWMSLHQNELNEMWHTQKIVKLQPL
jgi:hypothetical protein